MSADAVKASRVYAVRCGERLVSSTGTCIGWEPWIVGGTDHEHEQRRWRHAAAHEHAAVVHDRAAMAHRQAAEFFDEHGEPGKADRERQLADREAQKAEAARREASAGLEELPPDCGCPYRYPEPFR